MVPNGVAERFTPAENDRVTTQLLELRELLVHDLQAIEEAEARDAADLPPVATHLADLGSDRAAADLTLGCREASWAKIREIDEALERIRDGSFGLCDDCGEVISRARLEAIPYARQCLECRKKEEA